LLCQRFFGAIQIVTNKERLAALYTKVVQPLCLVAQSTKGTLKMGDIHQPSVLDFPKYSEERGQYAIKMRIFGNAGNLERIEAGFRLEQEVCDRCSKPLALGARKIGRLRLVVV
jgi:hypothetical protein